MGKGLKKGRKRRYGKQEWEEERDRSGRRIEHSYFSNHLRFLNLHIIHIDLVKIKAAYIIVT